MLKVLRGFRFCATPQNSAAFCTTPLNSVAVFNSKKYDIEFFNLINDAAAEDKRLSLHYFSEEMSDRALKLATDCKTVCCFVNDKVNAPILRKLSSMGIDLIALRCAGFNNVDMKEANKLNISVVRVPAYSPEAVAEFSMALILALNRKIHKAYNRTRDYNFALDGLLGWTLHGKTIGLLGMGRIGIAMARICKGFGMNVLAYDQYKNMALEAELGIKFVDESDLFYASDYISLHCPLTPQTKHVINEHTIAKMKDNVILINTGRGGLIETKSVVSALKKRKIAGLGIDVYEQEEKVFFKDVSSEVMQDDTIARLLSFPNVIMTGHQAFFTHEAVYNITKTTLDNITEFRATGKCANQVVP